LSTRHRAKTNKTRNKATQHIKKVDESHSRGGLQVPVSYTTPVMLFPVYSCEKVLGVGANKTIYMDVKGKRLIVILRN